MRTFAILLACLLTCGASCSPTREPPPPECPAPGVQVELQDRLVYVSIDADKTRRIVDPTPPITAATTYGEAVAAARAGKTLLGACNAKLEAIEAIEGSETR